jgi:peptidoglycan hydrolase CwlO-like protein
VDEQKKVMKGYEKDLDFLTKKKQNIEVQLKSMDRKLKDIQELIQNRHARRGSFMLRKPSIVPQLNT